MSIDFKYTKVEGKDKQLYTIINTEEAQQATWITLQNEKGESFIYGNKAFKNLFKKV